MYLQVNYFMETLLKKPIRPKRPSADKTRDKILHAAKKWFLAKGFEATYIKDIAKTARVNTNLIFHHFADKETLWCTVKSAILKQEFTTPSYDYRSAVAFFTSILEYRFALYHNHPDLAKLIQWQQLTENESVLIGTDKNSPNAWLDGIRHFQSHGKIRKDIAAEHIMLFIIFSSYAPFLQKVIPFDTIGIQHYQEMILQMCCNQFLE